jgi:CubicO group peptidase (beta-lactamase class C family)
MIWVGRRWLLLGLVLAATSACIALDDWLPDSAIGKPAATTAELTLLRDRADLIPLQRGDSVFVLRVQRAVRVRSYRELCDGLATRLSGVGDLYLGASNLPVLRSAAACSRILVVLPTLGSARDLPAGLEELVRVHPAVLVLAYGSAGEILQHFASVSTLVWVSGGAFAGRQQIALAAALQGVGPLTGRLREAIPGLADVGAGQSRFAVLRRSRLQGSGRHAELQVQLAALLDTQIRAAAFPGAVAMVTVGGEVVAEVARGRYSYEVAAKPVELHTRYDLASLTKVCATLPALAVLLENGAMHLDDRLSQWLPDFTGPAKSTVTLRQVAVHGAGVKPWAPFYRTLQGKSPFVEAATKQALVAAPLSQYQYSDLGMILLMAAIEQGAQQPMDEFVRRYVYPKLGVHAVFVPSGQRIPAAPTEQDAWRGRVIRGEVHDENAFAMGGVSGHAGLFGTAEDVARLGNAFLGGGGGLWKASTVRSLIRRVGLIQGSSRAIVWDTFEAGGSGGSLLSNQAFGHTGFTGTSVWCDPAGDVCMVLLTNRVHPSRQNTQIRGVRRAFCDLVVRCLKRT